MVTAKLRELLDTNHVPYTTIMHSPAFTAQRTAALAHIAGKQLAKSVIVKLDGKMAMVVQPASHQVRLGRLKAATGAHDARLADETELNECFTDCEPGAMPPFGNLYGMDVYVGERLTHDEEIAFNAGSHTELIKLAYRDFEKLVHPTVVAL